MAIDGLNSMSTEQLLALQLQNNGQLTGSSSSSNVNESDIAFQQVLQNYANKIGSGNNTALDNSSISTEQLLAMSLMTNGQLTNDDDDDSSRDMSDQVQMTNLLMLQALQNAAKNNSNVTGGESAGFTNQNCPTGQDLEKMAITVNNNPVNYADLKSPNASPAEMSKITAAVKEASKKYGVDENLILAVIKQESNFNSNAVSGAGAKGLMQIMPANFSSVGITNPYDVTQNVNGGTQMLKQSLDKYNGDISMALMAYNAGSGNMQKRGVTSASDLYKMPAETQKYVPSVLSYYKNGIN